MITLEQWFKIVNYRISEGSDYGRSCYGPNAHVLNSWDGEHNGHSFSVIFDTNTQEVYEVQAHDYQRDRAYRWFSPGSETRYADECHKKDQVDEAWEGVAYTTLEIEGDWLEKAHSIANGLEYDTRVQVQIEFNDEEILQYMKMAHDRDQTFNEFIGTALRHAIDQHKKETDSS